uniref:Cyclin-F n=1 Tax=Oncorhynchus tshawytscha TaxID=74940 RepID=A0AAZ3SJS9_ONCTS
MKVSVLHCRCSKCFTVPARKRVRKRVPALTLLSLPEEVLLCVLQCLSAEDLLAVRAVHSQLRDILDNHSSVWARVSFRDTWPSPNTVWLFERAAEKGNFEAAVKLGIAYLYNEGPLLSDEGRADVCGRKASQFFSLAESLRSPTADPFIWVFIRPPWSPTGSCCKAVVFDRLKAECETNVERRGTLLHCLARVLQLFDEDDKRAEALTLLEESSQSGCLQSAYLLWEHNRKTALSLAKVCSSDNPLGLEQRACADLVAQLFRSCPPVPRRRVEEVLRQGINDTMRYILVDWLVEVTTMKDFSSLTLHVTVGCVDRYLALRSVPKARLQLLGIACMVVCTRYISKDILTIREAVWLTDNTYKYEDLVRMMGEVISVLEGKIRTPTLLDYGQVLLSLLPLERLSVHLFSYLCELTLLYSALTTYSSAHLANAILLLTRALHHYAPIWPIQLAEYTGFSKQDLVPCTLLLYVKCFSKDVPKDYRQMSLTGVKQRFEDEAYQHISKEKVIDFKELCQVLEVPEVEPYMVLPSPTGQPADIHTFLSSPSSNSKRRREESLPVHRGSFVATPTAELSTQEETLVGDMLDWSLDTSCSGYEGDQESEGEKEAKEGETSVLAMTLELATEPEDSKLHCRALSSDDDSFCEGNKDEGEGSARSRPREPLSSFITTDFHSSGYSSVQSASPSSNSSSLLMPCTFTALPPDPTPGSASSITVALPGFRLLVPVQRPRAAARKQVKRKNAAAHSGGEREGEDEEVVYASSVGFLSL